MTKKLRHLLYETLALLFFGAGLAFCVPTLVSAHDTVALLGVVWLLLAWASWSGFLLYRLLQKGN